MIHLHQPNVEKIEAFARDGAWSDKPFWMLNTFRFIEGDAAREANRRYAVAMRNVLAEVGASVVMQAPVARTAIGERTWQAAALVRYPNPAAFYAMAGGDALAAASAERAACFADQFLVPVSPDWMPGFDPDRAVHPRAEIRTWTVDDSGRRTNAFIGEHHTQMTASRVRELLVDEGFDHGKPVYMLNLLKHAGDAGKSRHDAYVAGGGNDFPGGSLGRQFGLRVAFSARRVFGSLIGDVDWDGVAIVSYPSIHHFLSMGANADYIALHQGRMDGLARTYIVAMQPGLLVR